MKEKILTIIMLVLLIFAVIALAVSAQDGGQNKIVFLPNLYKDFNYLTPTVTPTETPTSVPTLVLDSPLPVPTKGHTPTVTPQSTKTLTPTPIINNCPKGTSHNIYNNGCYADINFSGEKRSVSGEITMTIKWSDYSGVPYVYYTNACGLVNNTGNLTLITETFPVDISSGDSSVTLTSEMLDDAPDGFVTCFFVNPVPLTSNLDISPNTIEFLSLW